MATADTYPARLCKLCRWFNPDFAPLETEADSLGLCEWPADRLPVSLRYGNRERVAVGPLEGGDCPAFEPRDVAAACAAFGQPVAFRIGDRVKPAGFNPEDGSGVVCALPNEWGQYEVTWSSGVVGWYRADELKGA